MIKKIITYIISFILSLCILLFASLLIFSNTILDKQYMISMLEKNNYYERTYEDIKDGFKNYIMQSGLEESILDNLYSKEKVVSDVNMVIESIYENKELQIDIQTIRNQLNNRINTVLQQNHRVPDAEEREAIQVFVEAIVDTYENGIVYSSSSIKKIGKICHKAQTIVKEIKMMCVAVIFVLTIIIIVVNCNIKKSLNAIGISLLTSGILCTALKLLIVNRIHDVLILNMTFSETLRAICQEIIDNFFTAGIAMIIVGLCSIIIGNLKKRQKQEKIEQEIEE